MSKKIAKRSLALGALMAFVITGSAMAGQTIESEVGGLTNASGQLELSKPTYAMANANYSDDSLTITSAGNAIGAYGIMNVTADVISLTTTGGGSGLYAEDAGSKLIVGVGKSLTINSNGHGINSGSRVGNSIIINAEGADVSVTADENAVDSRGNNSKIQILNAKDVTITSTNKGEQDTNWKGYAVMSRAGGSSVEITATGDVDITSARTAVYANKGDISVVGNTIDIVAGEGAGVRAGTSANDGVRGTGHVVLGDGNTESITIEGEMSYGIIARAANNNADEDMQSSVVVNGDSLVIGGDEESDIYYGIAIASGTDAGYNDPSTVVELYSAYTEVNAVNGIHNMSNGNLIVNGDLTINADESAIITRGYAETIINKAETNTVKINGDIEYNKYHNYPEKGATNTSVTDAKVVIKLTDEESYLNGNIIIVNGSAISDANKATVADINGMELKLAEQAKWNTKGSADSFVSKLSLNNGIVNHNSTGDIQVKSISGSGTVNFASNSGHLHIDSGKGSLKLSMDGATDFNDVAAKLGVSQAVKDTNSVTAQVVLAEGVVTGETTADVTYETSATDEYYHGKVEKANIHESVNTTNAGFSDAASLSLAAWRNSNDDMNKRLGELRDANGEHGVWVRMVRGESEYDSADYQANTYQLGYDQKAGDWTVGAAVSYTEGEGGFTNGSAEAENRGFSVYGSKLNGDGSYIDLVAKYARLDNELTTSKGVGSADYDTDGYAVSAEYGKRFAQSNGLWLEPQVQLTYGTVDSASFTTENGAKVNQDSFDSWVGRIGLRAGMDVKGGNVYARASYLYDFDGEASYTFADAANSRTIEDDLGGGWWEVGVGANINLSKATYIYADVEKTFGGEVDTNWQWNLGVRYSF